MGELVGAFGRTKVLSFQVFGIGPLKSAGR